ncbi:MAG: hypothetical protein J0M02_14135 [Planctomycetes bacterium]|nr:hypothetical protein [Planctomycetota bacterium]
MRSDRPARENRPRRPRNGSRGRSRITCLVATRDQQLLKTITARLEAAGMHVLTAATVAEAMTCLDKAMVEILIADIDEPQFGYGDLHKAVNASQPFVRRIAIARSLTLTAALNSFRVGAVGIIGAPLDEREFDRLIRQSLSLIRAWLTRLDGVAHRQPGAAPGMPATAD